MSAPVYNLRNKPGRGKMSELSSLNDSRSSVFQKVTSLLIPGNKSKTTKAIPEAPSFPTPSQSHHVSTISFDNVPVSNPVAFPPLSNILAKPSSPPPPAPNSFPTDAAQKENSTLNNLFKTHENHPSSSPALDITQAGPSNQTPEQVNQSLYLEPQQPPIISTKSTNNHHQQQEPAVTVWSSRPEGHNSTGIETWAQNLITPPKPPTQPHRSMVSSDHSFSSGPSNITLPAFWPSNMDLWFATAEHTFAANGIFGKNKRFSLVLNALELKQIQSIQHVIRSSTANPYRAIKQALIKSYKLNENDRLDVLFNRSQVGDRKPSELLNEMRQLLDAYDAHNLQTNAVLKKLFLDKLPPEITGILAASLETNLDSLATRANEVIAALAQNQFSQRPSTSQQLINQLFDQKLNKIIDQLQNSTPSQNFNLRPRQEQNSFASHSRPPP